MSFALLPASVADTFNSDGSLAVHQLDEAPARSIGLLQRKPCYLSPPAQVFVALLQQQVVGPSARLPSHATISPPESIVLDRSGRAPMCACAMPAAPAPSRSGPASSCRRAEEPLVPLQREAGDTST